MTLGGDSSFDGKSKPEFLLKFSSWLAVALGLAFLVTAAAGAINNFSPVPIWDMWNGYLDFYVRLLDGDYSAWWYKHVDHRLIVSRLLFFTDLRFFGGTVYFLILVNYLLAFASWLTLHAIAQSVLPGDRFATLRRLYAGISLALVFSWIQYDNFAFAFQGQMFAGVLFPMLAFILLYRSGIAQGRESSFLFAGSLAAGVISGGTMMNGLAALPIMVILGMRLRLPKLRISLIIASTVAVYILYFRGFTPSRSFSQSLLAQPLDVITFFLAYIGAPAHYIFRDGFTAAVISGSVIILVLCWQAIGALRKPADNPAVNVVFAVLLYGILTCIGVSSSRIYSGMGNAFFGRYMTNIVILWAAMILLLLYRHGSARRIRVALIVLALAIPSALLPWQLPALDKNSNALADRLVLALALELGVRDGDEIGPTYPWNFSGSDHIRTALSQVKAPIERDLSIFGSPLIKDAEKSLGRLVQDVGVQCLGDIETIRLIPGEGRFLKMEGLLIDRRTGLSPKALYVLDASRRVVGYGVTGFTRQGLIESEPVSNAGFVAYIKSESIGGELTLRGKDVDCEATPISESRLGTTDYFSVDGLNDIASPKSGIVIPITGKSFQISGYAVDQVAGRAASRVVIMVDGQAFLTQYGGERPDIADALKNKNFLHSQYWADIPTGGLAKGLHDVSLRVVAADRSGYYEAKWAAKLSVE